LPSVLNSNFSNIIDSIFIQKLIKEFYEKYDQYDLGSILLNYWVAVSSNSITAAVLYGAQIEKLQRRYIEINNTSYTRILDKSIFRKLKEKLLIQLEGVDLNDNQKKLFANKIENMNTFSQKDIMNFFCQDISLSLSESEKKAWQQRNDAAHGNDSNDLSQAWQNTLVLRELVNKVILRLITSNKYYLSYLVGEAEVKEI
jgi:hypothetical protein